MTTAQQLGLVGNSVRVQALPTASAETFGQGNRYYTLIGQQEGYITGHTYHTVVANDVYSWEDVACGNYNMLDNIPVINQDLTASDFTPVANTYYRHTGSTTATFTQGVIYLYDTAYHKLGESGGTTLNKYTVSGPSINLLRKIILNSKGHYFGQFGYTCDNVLGRQIGLGALSIQPNGIIRLNTVCPHSSDNNVWYIVTGVIGINDTYITNGRTLKINSSDSAMTILDAPAYYQHNTYIVYYNDTEITA